MTWHARSPLAREHTTDGLSARISAARMPVAAQLVGILRDGHRDEGMGEGKGRAGEGEGSRGFGEAIKRV